MNFDPFQPGAWPGLSNEMQQAAGAIYAGQGVNPNKFFVRPHAYFHRIDYAAAGAATLNLFNVNPAPFVCNLPIQGTIANETAFRLDCVRVRPITGIVSVSNYTRAAGGSQLGANLTAFPNAEEVRTIMENGALTISVGDKNIVDNQFDLTRFPAGRGFSMSTAAATTTGSTNAEAAQFSNGQPDSSNGQWWRPGFMILPGKRIQGQIVWPGTLAVTTGFQIVVELCGLLVSPSNN